MHVRHQHQSHPLVSSPYSHCIDFFALHDPFAPSHHHLFPICLSGNNSPPPAPLFPYYKSTNCQHSSLPNHSLTLQLMPSLYTTTLPPPSSTIGLAPPIHRSTNLLLPLYLILNNPNPSCLPMFSADVPLTMLTDSQRKQKQEEEPQAWDVELHRLGIACYG